MMPNNRRSSVSAKSRQSLPASSPGSRMIRSQVYTQSGYSHTYTSSQSRRSTSLPGPSSSRLGAEAVARAERLGKWMARSSVPITQAWSILPMNADDSNSRPSTAGGAGSNAVVNSSNLGRPTRASLLRSKTCPVRPVEPNYTEQIRKQKDHDYHYKVLSTSMTIPSHTLPNGEQFHSFLIGARYNSAVTVDSRLLGMYGIHVPKKNTRKVFVNRAPQNPPSAKVFGNQPRSKAESSHKMVPMYSPNHPIDTQSKPHFQHSVGRTADCANSVERQLDKVFGSNVECSLSDVTIMSASMNLKDDKESALVTISMSEEQGEDAKSQNENKCEEQEQDFISHEAQELTQEILQQCRLSTSSSSSGGNAPDERHSWTETSTIVHDKVLQSGLEGTASDENKHLDDENRDRVDNDTEPLATNVKRPSSAHIIREKSFIEPYKRPQSAIVNSSIVVDMTELQAVELVDS